MKGFYDASEKDFIGTGEMPVDNSERMRTAVEGLQEKRTKRGGIKGTHAAITEDNRRVSLTAKQRLFAGLIIEGHSQKEAYVKAYDVRTDNQAVISNSAYKLAQNPRVKELLEGAISKRTDGIIGDEIATRRMVMTALIDHAQNMKGESAKLKALELIGKSIGMFTDRIEQSVNRATPEQLKEELSVHLALLDSLPAVSH